MSEPVFSIGVDYGTNAVRVLVVRCDTGEEIGAAVYDYKHGEKGILAGKGEMHLARQSPRDYIDGLNEALGKALAQADGAEAFSRERIVGIGVSATASTPVPVDREAVPLGVRDEFQEDLSAQAWLWKDHTSIAEAEEIVEVVKKKELPYLKFYSGLMSPEWFWPKALKFIRSAPEVVRKATAAWLELTDLVPAYLTGVSVADDVVRGICSAGFKGMYSEEWGGYPPKDFLKNFSEEVARLAGRSPVFKGPGESVGSLSDEMASRYGLSRKVQVSAGIIDAHSGALGSGVGERSLVSVMGTSSCNIGLIPYERYRGPIPGISGVIKDGVVPGMYAVESGQGAVGDIFAWFVERILGGRCSHEELTERARNMGPGETGLVALDWHNGNRNVLMDMELSGLIVGLRLDTTVEQIYRALIEATAFGLRTIIERKKEYGYEVENLIACGGIAKKNDLVCRIYADVLGVPVHVAGSSEACALGAAVCGAVAGGAFQSLSAAQEKMVPKARGSFEPNLGQRGIWDEVYGIYRDRYEHYSRGGGGGDIMKSLLALRDEAQA